MLVFGDLRKMEQPSAALESLAAQWALSNGSARASLYVDAARIAQGCVDAEFETRGKDGLTPLHVGALNMLRDLGLDLKQNCRRRGADALRAFAKAAGTAPVETRIAEGFVFYALHPQACFAARGHADVVIGLRSIGMALAPLLGLALGAENVITLRPAGHPFMRVCALDGALCERLKALRRKHFALIDEGPGLSGSSLGAAADALEGLGIARENISFYASHAGALGPVASAPHRERWTQARKHALTRDPSPASWKTAARVSEVSYGGWRRHGPWPDAPSSMCYERAKFLLRRRGQTHLAKFIGLGAIAAHKERIARLLAGAGFTPKCVRVRDGYLVERWIAATPIDLAPREHVIAHLARYLAFRAHTLPAPDLVITPMADLLAMARFNTRALGPKIAVRLASFECELEALARAEHPVATDNRMHRWEWLVRADGAILKADAIDHHLGHDLIGPRDIAWDAAGAIVELDLSRDERAHFLALMAQRKAPVSQLLLDFYLPVYCAFQFGAADINAQACAPADAQLWRSEQARYERHMV